MTDLQLDTLESKGLISLATVQPELEYLFRHALIQDTAYESLLKQERRALHLQVGEALEQLYPDRRGDLSAILALHFEQAGETDRAINYLMDAGAYAFARNAIVEAFDLYSRADNLLSPPSVDESPESLRLRVAVALGRSRAGVGFLSSDQQLEILEPALEHVRRAGDLRLEADVNVQAALMRGFGGERPDQSEPLREALERTSQIARELDDPLIAALPRSLVGLYQVFSGRLRAGVTTLAENAPLLAAKRDFVGSSFARMALALGYARLGEFDRAEDAIREAERLAEDGDVIAKLDTMIGQSNIALLRGDLDAAVPLARQCVDLAESTGATACVAGSNLILGDAFMQRGQFGDAKIAFERGSEVADVLNQGFRPSLVAFTRANSAWMGDFSPHARTFDEALDEARGKGDRWSEAHVLWKRAEAEARRGADANVDDMLADFAAAWHILHEVEARPVEARVLRDWGRALATTRQADLADTKLRRAQELFAELGMGREADALSAEVAA